MEKPSYNLSASSPTLLYLGKRDSTYFNFPKWKCRNIYYFITIDALTHARMQGTHSIVHIKPLLLRNYDLDIYDRRKYELNVTDSCDMIQLIIK